MHQTVPTVSNKNSTKFTQLEYSLIVFVLKKFSDINTPLSAADIAEHICDITGKEHSEKTILRKLNHICEVQADTANTNVINTLWLSFGGTVVEVSNLSKKNITKKQSRFYFKPILNESDLALICGTIASNRYLSDAEKSYLIATEKTLNNFNFDDKQLIQHSNTYHKSKLINIINSVYDSITKGYVIEVIYGVYDIDEKLHNTCFHAKNEHKPYHLNPYAMLWNNGSLYLLATHYNHSNPVHFRVDRIISVKPVPTEDDATIMLSRKTLPDELNQFFNYIGNNQYEFLPEKYTATYPLMGIYDVTNYQDCYIECTSSTLSILIDAFGTNLRIYPSNREHTLDATDFHGRPQKFLIAIIKNVQYDNILQFCLQLHTSIVALSPSNLVDDIRNRLQDSLNKYNIISNETFNPPM